MITFPNAKINLGLDVVERRTDGYHNISTMFYPIPLCDVLEMSQSDGLDDVTLTVYGNKIDCPAEKNLVVKAYRAFANQYEIPPVEFHLAKRIPDGAGLGGGSADAAFALTMLRDTFVPHVDNDKLASIASSIGADCPFFIFNRPMFAEGIGNIFSDAPEVLAGYSMILIKPDVYVSTKEAYSHITPCHPEVSVRQMVCGAPDAWRGLLKNDFEPGVFALHPQLAQIKQDLYDAGALYASMSGSGSSVYGIFDNANLAEKYFRTLTEPQKFLLAL